MDWIGWDDALQTGDPGMDADHKLSDKELAAFLARARSAQAKP